MDSMQAAKSLLKKLSALRATIPDDEQLLLDKLILGDGEMTPPATPSGPADIAINDVIAYQSPKQDNPASPTHKSNARKIVWNADMEKYELG